MKLTIPAVRIAVSAALKGKHGMSETEIAKRLGTTQAAVSKYIKHSYSKNVGAVVKIIESKKLHMAIVDAIIKGKSNENMAGLIDRAASGKEIVAAALKLLQES